MTLVAIDAGHGSNTAGKRHPDGYREHYSNTYTAFYLDQILTKNGFTVLKTGWNDVNAMDDVDTPLADRQKAIKSAKCEYSISIHANAFGDGKSYNSGRGTEVLIHNQADKVADSKKLADAVHKELIKGTPQKDRGVKTMALAMCNCKTMNTKASILIEMAFMTNEEESKLLKDDAFLRETAREIAQGFFNYVGFKGNVNIPLIDVKTGKLDGAVEPAPAPTPTPAPTPVAPVTPTVTGIKAGRAVTLNKANLYRNSSTTVVSSTKTGTFYLWDDKVVNGRIKITNRANRVGVTGQITGWINVVDTGISSIVNTPVKESAPVTNSTTKNLKTGDVIQLKNTPLYRSSGATTAASVKTGTYYVWSNTAVNGKIRITNAAKRVGVAGQITGWVKLTDI